MANVLVILPALFLALSIINLYLFMSEVKDIWTGAEWVERMVAVFLILLLMLCIAFSLALITLIFNFKQ